MQTYAIEIVALDSSAGQAIDLAEPIRFDNVIKTDLKHFSEKITHGYRQILLLSKLDTSIFSEIKDKLSKLEEPIIILPQQTKQSEEIKQLVLMGVRILFTSSENITMFSLSQTLRILQMVFYENDSDMEVSVNHSDIYEVIGKGTVTEFLEESGSNVSTVMMNTINTPKSFSDTYGVITLFEISETLPLIQIAEALDIIEDVLPETSSIVFVTRNIQKKLKDIKITCMVSRYIDFTLSLQKEINNAETYMEKVALIIDAFASGIIDGEEADFIALRNDLAPKDLHAIFTVAYDTPSEIVNLMKHLREEKVSIDEKEEALAKALVETSIDPDLIEEIAITHKLSTENILKIYDLLINKERNHTIPIEKESNTAS
jgi:hypothetical protein